MARLSRWFSRWICRWIRLLAWVGYQMSARPMGPDEVSHERSASRDRDAGRARSVSYLPSVRYAVPSLLHGRHGNPPTPLASAETAGLATSSCPTSTAGWDYPPFDLDAQDDLVEQQRLHLAARDQRGNHAGHGDLFRVLRSSAWVRGRRVGCVGYCMGGLLSFAAGTFRAGHRRGLDPWRKPRDRSLTSASPRAQMRGSRRRGRARLLIIPGETGGSTGAARSRGELSPGDVSAAATGSRSSVPMASMPPRTRSIGNGSSALPAESGLTCDQVRLAVGMLRSPEGASVNEFEGESN
jgi:hypothetical protein